MERKKSEEEILRDLGLKIGQRVVFGEKFKAGIYKGKIGIIEKLDEDGDLRFTDENGDYLTFLRTRNFTKEGIKENFTIIEEKPLGNWEAEKKGGEVKEPLSHQEETKQEILKESNLNWLQIVALEKENLPQESIKEDSIKPKRPGIRINLIDSKIPTPASVQEEEEVENYLDYLSSENRGLFNKLSSKAKEIAIKVYKDYKLQGAVDKLGIAQFWVDRYEEKAVPFKNKMDSLDSEVKVLEQSKKEIESEIKNLQSQNTPGVTSLQLKIKVIDQQIINLLKIKDETQSKFEAKENIAKLYINERNGIIDKIIGHYNEKLEPIETELENLQNYYSGQVNLDIAKTEVERKEQIVKLNNIKKTITQIEMKGDLHGKKMSGVKIRELEKQKKQVEWLAKNIEKEKETLNQRKRKINEEIAKLDAKANKHRDKKEHFIRIKKKRLLQMEGSPRQTNLEFINREEIRTHPRREAGESPEIFDNSKKEPKETLEDDLSWREKIPSTLEESIQKPQEAQEDNEEMNLPISKHIDNWNNEKKDGRSKIINLENFLEEIGQSKDWKINFQDFRRILKAYYELKKIKE